MHFSILFIFVKINKKRLTNYSQTSSVNHLGDWPLFDSLSDIQNYSHALLFQMDAHCVLSYFILFVLSVAYYLSVVILFLVPWFVVLLPNVPKLLIRMIFLAILVQCITGKTEKCYNHDCLAPGNFYLSYPGNYEFCAYRYWDNPFSNNHYGSIRRLLLLTSGLES